MTTINRTIKGITRLYRKALRKIGLRNFPLSGAFHCRDNGITITPEQVTASSTVKIGPAPLVVWKRKTPAAPAIEPLICEGEYDAIRTNGIAFTPPAPILPALTVEPVFRRVTSIGVCNGKEKTRVNYRPIRNAKAGQRVWVKRTVNDKPKWAEVAYSDLLNPVSEAS